MEFLGGTKQILRFLDVYTRPPVNLGCMQISSHFIEWFAFISMLVTTIPIGAFCFVNRNNFRVASAGVPYFIANSSIKIIYLALLLKRNSVIESIDHLEELIKSRKQKLYFSFISKSIPIFFRFEGVCSNMDMLDFHSKRDQVNTKLAKNLLQSGIYMVSFFFLSNTTPPFSHLLLEWPKHVIWNFPFPVVYVKAVHQILENIIIRMLLFIF